MPKKKQGQAHGIPLKKQFGQHFLRTQRVVDVMLQEVALTSESSVFEIGCGDGFLTRSLLQFPIKQLWVFEIDPDWAAYVKTTYADSRMSMFQENILDVDFSRFEADKPWLLIANLPYQITFPLLHKLQKHRDILQEAVVMLQEEVAQKIVKTHGRGYGFPSLYFQHYFNVRLLEKVPASAFYPPPKVTSRLLHFVPRQELDIIPQEDLFWKFIKRCFASPRRTLKNNLQSCHYPIEKIPDQLLGLRAQQLAKQDFLMIWELILGDSNRVVNE